MWTSVLMSKPLSWFHWQRRECEDLQTSDTDSDAAPEIFCPDIWWFVLKIGSRGKKKTILVDKSLELTAQALWSWKQKAGCVCPWANPNIDLSWMEVISTVFVLPNKVNWNHISLYSLESTNISLCTLVKSVNELKKKQKKHKKIQKQTYMIVHKSRKTTQGDKLHLLCS